MNPIQTIAAIKGTSLTVFIMLCALGGKAGVKELSINSGYNRKTVGTALQHLTVFLLVAKMFRYDGWTVTSKGKELFEAILNPGGVTATLPPTSSSINNLIDLNKDSITTTSGENTLPEISKEIYGLLRDAGIGDPKRTELAQMEHITPEYLEAHLASDLDLALIIWKMEREHEAPGHIDGCQCEDCANKYITGKFAGSINH